MTAPWKTFVGWRQLLLLLSCSLLTVLTQQQRDTSETPPSFSMEVPRSLEFSNSTGSQLQCSASGHPQPNVTWILSDGSPVRNIPGLRYVDLDGTLTFSPFRAEDFRQDVHATSYRCSAKNAIGTILTKNIQVKGVVSQSYDVYVYDVYVIKGNPAVIKCHIPEMLAEFVTVTSWVRGSVIEIKQNDYDPQSKYSMMPNGDLYVKDSNSEDSMTSFRCRTTDRLTGKTKLSVTAGKLIITDPKGRVPPKIINGRKQVITEVDSTVFLPCVAQGHPPPTVRWFRRENGEENEDIEISKRLFEIGGSLLIKNVRKSESGIYSCIASNSAGQVKKETEVVIADSLYTSIEPSSTVVDLEKSATLICKISGHPVNRIIWLKDGKPLNHEQVQFLNNETLKIEKMTPIHKGIYQCFAENEIDSSFGTAYLKIGDITPSFTVVFTEKILHPGRDLQMKCIASGNPIPKITWTIDDMDLPKERRISIDESIEETGQTLSTLSIKNSKTEDGGLYSCTATNKAGVIKHAARVNIYGKLGSRKRPRVSAVSSGNVTLTCPVYGYPFHKILWERNGILLPAELRQILTKNKELMIKNLHKTQDSGLYNCKVQNEDGIVSGEVELAVMVPPKLAPFSFQEELVREGMRGRLQCVVLEGDLPLTLSWEKDGKAIPEGVTIRKIDDFSTILNIHAITPRHNGAYTCIAKNEAATVRHTTRLSVNVPPKILPFAFQDDQFFKGMRAHLFCSVSQGDVPIHFEWLKDNQKIPVSMGVLTRNIDGHASSLSIESVSSIHSGNYTCIASNDAAVVSHTTQLLVYVSPQIIPFSFQDMNVVEGVLARVSRVVYQGDLPIDIQWIKDGQAISPSLGITMRKIDDYSSILTIDSVQTKHTGNYTCIASNAAATITHSAQLIVNVPPQIVPFTFQDETLLEGMVVRVSCVVSRGDLPLTITWLKDGQEIPSQLNIKFREFDEYSSILSIDPVAAKHSGNYSCIATNHAATISHSARLMVQVPPKWIKEPIDAVANIDDEIYLHCQTEGYPKPVVQWVRIEGDDLSNDRISLHNDSNTVIYANGTLHLKQIKKNLEGYFYCISSNNVGVPKSKSIFLTVNAAPELEHKFQNVEGRKGENLTLICRATGNLPISFQWAIASKLINQQMERYRIETRESTDEIEAQSELSILWLDRKDSSTVECKAENKFGSNKMNFHLNVLESPEAPKFERKFKTGNRSIEVHWKPEFHGNSPIVKYLLQYKRNIDNWQYKSINKTLSGSANSAVVVDLQAATKYDFRIMAENQIGKSIFSEVITIATGEEVPSGAPINIEVESTDTDTLRITWKPPKKSLWNGAIRGYNIGYRVHGSDDPFSFTTLEVPEDYTEDLIFQLMNLKMFTQYGIIVQAYNSKGSGPSSEEILAMTSEDVPAESPKDVRCSALSAKSIYVLWEPPQPESINGILRGFKVLYKPVEEWYDAERNSKITQSSKLTLQDLMPNTNYSIQLAAFTKIGDGPRSLPIFCKTHEDVPEAPIAIKVLPSSSDSVMVSWKSAKKARGSVTKYNIYYKPLEDGQEVDLEKQLIGDSSMTSSQLMKDTNVHSSSSDSQFFEVKGLQKNRKYAFWVTASSVIGEGPISKVMAQTVADTIVPPKASSFDDNLNTPWKKDIVLTCKAVGVPTPQKKWYFKNLPLESTGRVNLLSDGTIIINRVVNEDSGNYTCSIYNEYGKDEVKYSLRVQVPPSTTILDVVSKSKTSIQLQWKPGPNGGDRIRGYILHYRRESSVWESKELVPEHNVYTLDGLACGTTYQIYIEAFNSIGVGAPCDIITVNTEGAEITPPHKDDLIREGTTFITVNLDTWPTNGCPIEHFTIEFKQHSVKDWTVVSSNILPSQKKLVIPGLSTSTWYILRLTVHTSGGSTTTEYKFATHTPNGGTIAPETFEEDIQPVYLFYLDPYIFIPAVALLIVVIVASVTVCICFKRRNGSEGSPSVIYSDGSTMNTWGRTLRHPGGNVFIHPDGYATISRNRKEDPSPYATSHVLENHPGTSADNPGNWTTANINRFQETTFMFPGNMNHPPLTTPMKKRNDLDGSGYDPPPFGM